MADDDARVDRRRVLAALAAAGLAGCTESSDPTATEDSTPPATTTPEATPTATDPSTDTPTATPESTPEPRALDDTWPGYGNDLGNSGMTDGMPLTGNRRQWATNVDGDNTLPEPVVTRDAIHVTTENFLYGIDRETGVISWKTDIGAPAYFFTSAVGDGSLYVPARNLTGVFNGSDTPGELLAIDSASGDVRWRREAFVTSSPVLGDGLLYHAAATATEGSVEALSVSPDGGSQAWRYRFGDGEHSAAFGTPALDDGRLFATGTVGQDDAATGRLVALDAATGARQWRVTASAPTENAPACSDGDVFFSDDAGVMYSVDGETGSTNWTHEFDAAPVNKPSVGNGLVYVLADSTLHAVDRADGTHQWSSPTDPVEDNVTATTEHVYVGGTTLDAFDATTGDLSWQREIGGYTGAFGVPVVVDGYLYVGVCVKETEKSIYANYVYLLG
jgi:outer membrane protein assembly factor BamB